jgi:hypothetical protein
MTNPDTTAISARLGLSERCAAWLDRIPTPAHPPALQVPDDAAADALLERLGTRPDVRAACLAARPDPVANPDLWWVLERAYHDIVGAMQRDAPPPDYLGWPNLPEHTGAPGQFLYVWALLAATPHVRRYHQERDIPDDVSWHTLGGLGSTLNALGRLEWTWMHPLLFSGRSYHLGRHVFDRGSGDLNVHIPHSGRLGWDASDASFAWAREFFPRHFPAEPLTGFTCHSWLLDDQWQQYLPDTSNIVRFQRRFTLLPDSPDAHPASGDFAILEFVFDRTLPGDAIPSSVLDGLPQETTLQRAFVQHLRAGGHWRTRTGRFDV